MISRTKNQLSGDEIKKLVNREFPSENSGKCMINELGDGSFNAAYRIQLGTEREIVLKVAPATETEVLFYERNIMKTEVEAIKMVHDKLSVPVPEIYSYHPKEDLNDIEYFFMEKLDGESYDSIKDKFSLEERQEINQKLGEYNKQLNEIQGTYFGYPGVSELQGDKWENVFVNMVEKILQDGEKKDIEIGVSYDEIRSLVDKNKYVLQDVTTPHFVHWDLWDGNVLIKDKQISGIIDFERFLWGDPLMEYYFCEIIDGNADPSFLDGYGKTEFSEAEINKRILYNLYVYLIMIIDHTYRGYDDDGLCKWAKGLLGYMVRRLRKI